MTDMDLQNCKRLVLDFHTALDTASSTDMASTLERFVTPDYRFRGVHPFDERTGAGDVAEVLWRPLHASFAHLQRRPHLFFAGESAIDGGHWVCSAGNLMGLFDADWLGIPATRRIAFLPYAEFNRVTGEGDDARVSETGLFVDIVAVMRQAGAYPLPPQTGAAIINPGPRPQNGLLIDVQGAEETAKTLALVTRMMEELTGSDMDSSSDELGGTWHDDMLWWGPAGIGATYTLERYREQHADPFNRGLADIVFNGHVARFAEGSFAGWFGWPNLSMRPSGGFMGLPSSNKRADMRVVDLYRRQGDKLAENWVYIDLLHFLKQQGVDVLGRLAETGRA